MKRRITPESQRYFVSTTWQVDDGDHSAVGPPWDAAVAGRVLSDLADLYVTESRIAAVLPRMLKGGLSDELRKAMSAHSRKTNDRLEVIARISSLFCQSVSQLLPEDGGRMAGFGTALLYSTALISILEGVDFPKINSYGRQQDWERATFDRLLEWAGQFDSAEGADFLEEILKEEESGMPATGRMAFAV